MLSDTCPEAARVQIELLRRCGAAERFARTESLTTTTRKLSRRAIAKANPHLTEAELDLKCVELYYGKELATQMAGHLKRSASSRS